jgi:coenzyme F420 hydrogenase subunit beta
MILETLVAHGLCAGCGLCESVAGRDHVRMEMSPQGYLRPRRLSELAPETLHRILDCCPGVKVDGAIAAPGATIDGIWGPYVGLTKSHAADPEIRFKASSGGTLTELCGFLLDTGRIDFVLHVGTSREAPMRSERRLSFDRAQLLDAVGARYGPAAPLTDFVALLDRGQRFALVGKPCDIAAVRNYGRIDARVARLVPYMLTFFCGGVPSLTISQRMVGKYGLSEPDVGLLRYRGHGCPGMTRIESRDGRAFEQTYDETWGDELNQDIQFRCKICPDATGELADIVCGDAWITEDGYPAFGDQEGWNAVIARTPRGAALLDEARAASRLVVVPMSLDELSLMQPHHLERKKAVAARLAAMALAGQPIPRYRHLRLVRCALMRGAQNLANFLGMLRRLRRRANRKS